MECSLYQPLAVCLSECHIRIVPVRAETLSQPALSSTLHSSKSRQSFLRQGHKTNSRFTLYSKQPESDGTEEQWFNLDPELDELLDILLRKIVSFFFSVMQKNCCCDDYFHRQCHIRCSAVGWQDGSEGEGTCCPA